MIIKTGIDIIEVNRIEENIKKHGEHFLKKVFTDKEIEYCESKKAHKYESYAGKFAAKEAIFKAISECLNNKFEIDWKDIEILNSESGMPYANVFYNGKLVNCEISVSISHIKEIAVANVVVVWN